MIHLNKLEDCCGCGACEQICSFNAIFMQRDKRGFLYPKVNLYRCVDCGICEKVCPILIDNEERIPLSSYALKNKNDQIRKESSSGGVFSIIAEDILHSGGVVYGAVFDEKWIVRHTPIRKIGNLSKLRGSKYVQSIIGDSYTSVRDELKKGNKVLFSGTPCQVAGLKSFLQKDYQNLLTIDLVCHGVPSPQIWEDYLREILSNRKGVSISDIRFRDKSTGWKEYCFRYSLSSRHSSQIHNKNCDIRIESGDNFYMKSFLKNYTLRPSCHECHFRSGKSGSDYTMADFWGIEHICHDFFDDQGVSLFLQYKDCLPSNFFDNCEGVEVSYEDALSSNLSIKHSWPKMPEESVFYFFHNTFRFNIRNCYRWALFFEYVRLKLEGISKRYETLINRIRL